LSARLGIDVLPVSAAEEAVKDAEIVAACTDSIVPVIPGRCLEDGAFVCTVKGSMEMDEETVQRVSAFFTFAPNAEVSASDAEPASRAQLISGVHRAYVAGRPEELARIPRVKRARGLDKRKLVSFKDLFEGKINGRIDARQILAVGGNRIQGIQFASVGGATYRLIKEKGLGREFPTDWLLQDIRN
jgi:ornithine cyclodeaminase/alanine dehydrogenase-like protein (mu-crystallin family)